MVPEAVLIPETRDAGGGLPGAWRQALAGLAGTWLALLLVFHRDWLAMADQWWNISTYTHVLLIPPILAWQVWQRWPQLRQLRPDAWWPGLILSGSAALLWVMGEFAGFNLARQLAAVAMLASVVPLLMGPRVSWALIFPLSYMVFLVPFGDELVPALQLITAKLTIGLVHLTGVKATIDGVFIGTPAGLFEVAEACSGVKFLIAMIAFGVLACQVCFRSHWRRAGFMLLCLVTPVLANGIRAWGTIYLAQSIGAEAASGFDHIVYGWIFFALVLVLVITLGWRYFDRPADAPFVNIDCIGRSPMLSRLSVHQASQGRLLAGLAMIVAVITGWSMAESRLRAPLPAQIYLPEVAGWQRVDYAPSTWWQPRASGAEHRLLGSYSDGKGHRVDVFLALYSHQADGREAGAFGEGALTPGTDWQWLAPGQTLDGAKSDRLRSVTGRERVALTWYRSGNLLTGSKGRLKLAIIGDRLTLRARPITMLILSSETGGEKPPFESIVAFRKSIGPEGLWMDRIAGVR